MEKSLDILTDSKPEGNLQWEQLGKLTRAELVTSSCQMICLLDFKMYKASKVLGNWLNTIRLYLSSREKREQIWVFKIYFLRPWCIQKTCFQGFLCNKVGQKLTLEIEADILA